MLSVSKHSVGSGPGCKFIERHTKTRSLYVDNNGYVREGKCSRENSNGRREDIRMDVNWIKPAQDSIQQLALKNESSEFIKASCVTISFSRRLLLRGVSLFRLHAGTLVLVHALPYLQSTQHRKAGTDLEGRGNGPIEVL